MTAGLLLALGLMPLPMFRTTGLDQPAIEWGVSVTPATPISITIIGSSVAITIVGSVVAIAVAVIATAVATAIMSPGVSVVVGNLLDLRVRDSGTIQRECGYGVGRAGTRK